MSAASGWLEVIPRTARVAPGGMVYHVLIHAVVRLTLFRKDAHGRPKTAADRAGENIKLGAYLFRTLFRTLTDV